MGSEVYQAQVIKAFFDTVTGTDRNLTRVYLCVMSLAKLRNESPEKLRFLVEQLQASKQKRELSIDILDYVADAANSLSEREALSVFGITETHADDFGSVSMDSF